MLVVALLVVGLATALATYATRDSHGNSSSATIAQATPAQLKAAGLGQLGLRPESERVDVVSPRFSNPTSITNPLFPISGLHSAILSGTVDGKPPWQCRRRDRRRRAPSERDPRGQDLRSRLRRVLHGLRRRRRSDGPGRPH